MFCKPKLESTEIASALSDTLAFTPPTAATYAFMPFALMYALLLL